MKKYTPAIVKATALLALAAPLAFAADSSMSTSTIAEPIYLSICGLILLSFGMLKGKKSDA